MHLKTLTIKGFKSFASSTTLRLEPGITAVVGPNGSGKSNVVDALTWVMGEQGAKNLRGGSMADVIFAGAGKRAPLGRAEVSLTIDNTDGALPIDYTEVTITRTLFRGGGSEYQINGTPCRLLDVQELLSDTGLGRQMHVIVGQGRLDEVLSATPEERRGFIEEAAGVLKHRRRKERALRKLDSMAADLARVTDLTAELRRQLGPLARQAAVARRARTIQVEVRDAAARLLADDVVQTQSLLEAGDEDQTMLARRRAGVEEAERVARARLAELSAVEATSGQRLARATSVWEELTRAEQSLASLAEVAAERARGLAGAPRPAFGTDPAELERRAEVAAAEEAELADAIEDARTALSDASRERADAESAESSAEAALSGLQRRQAEHREKLARAGGRVASARSRHEAALAGLEQARSSLASAERRAEEARTALAEQTGSPDAATTGEGEPGARGEAGADGALDSEQARAAAAHEAATEALGAARDAVSAATDARREAASERASWTARRDTLALSLHAQDGTAELAEAGLPGVLGTLAESISVERGWENAVAALLGELAGAALVEDADAAVAALEHARAQDAGALRLVLADVPAAVADGAEEALAAVTAAGIEGAHVARGLVTVARPGLDHALDRLLAAALVVPDLPAARAVRAAAPEAVVATRDGEVLAPERATGAGRGTSSVLELAAAHEDAADRAEAAARAEADADAALEEARHGEETARRVVSEALAALRAADAEAARAAEALAGLTSAVRAAEDEAGRARRVLERAENEASQRTTELASATAALAEIEDGAAGTAGERSAPSDLEAAIAVAGNEREAAVAAARTARAAETEARLALRTAEERERSGRGRSDSLRAAARREREQRAAAERAEARRTARLTIASHVRDQARDATAAARGSVEEAQRERARIESDRSEAISATSAIREELDGLTSELSRLTDAAHRDEIARAEQRTRLQALADRAMSELGLELEPLVEEYGPHMLVPEGTEELLEAQEAEAEAAARASGDERADGTGDPDTDDDEDGVVEPRRRVTGRPYVRAEQEKRLAKATRDLTRLGKVNPLALEEHAALEQRHQFLAEQLADLKQSRADLLAIVEQIDARVQEVFARAYEDTAREFALVFDRLFPGGEGRLVLTDPEDMLTTGIEIEARPAGKKVKRLSLLSGGERSLAAVALLVAIFKARPSPFYVMDEVEAALDDTNLGRLLDIFIELRESSQLIIITHQKRTMEVADALYGITMRDGVTQAVSQRLAGREKH
ncbi:chromosome segregation protein SMC [Actinomyces radicidentis]|uniref:Chromosome partition protein Smc n=1 Tax=Actinomyces radicidentis TaxID=111015 RepID=A0A109W2T3_ACTRD|nr:chromosome segregation protein SMC [Actinomyces radicidentis]AMD87635.1 chromosome segregation protein SMC [Actinomyces radicidentis]